MRYCKRCGNKIDETTIFCPMCAQQQSEPVSFGAQRQRGAPVYTQSELKGSRAVAVLSFFFTVVGLILWLVFKDTRPGMANSAAKGALAGVCFGTPLFGLIFWLLWRNTYPEYAKICGISAIVGAAFAFVYYILTLVLYSMGYYIPNDFLDAFLEGYYQGLE